MKTPLYESLMDSEEQILHVLRTRGGTGLGLSIAS